MKEENKMIAAEPSIPYGNQNWFPSNKDYYKVAWEHKNFPYSGSSVHYENRELERTWKIKTEQHIRPFSIIFISYNNEDFGKDFFIDQILLKKKEFEYYMNEWKANRDSKSSILKSLADRNYQKIIKMGKEALPFIFSEIQRIPDDWFDALFEITGENPTAEKHSGDFIEMTNDWIKWAKVHNYR